jgi:hypothetical protein
LIAAFALLSSEPGANGNGIVRLRGADIERKLACARGAYTSDAAAARLKKAATHAVTLPQRA